MRYFNLFAALLLFVCAFSINLKETEIKKDTPINGTLEKKGSTSVTLIEVRDWRIVTMAFRAMTSQPDYSSVVATITATCDDKRMEMKLIDGIMSTHYSDGDVCDSQKTVITIQSLTNEKIDYWGIAADQDRYMYPIVDNSEYYGVVAGFQNREFVSYRSYIGKSGTGSAAIDVVNVTVTFDAFAGTKLRGFVSAENPRPTSRMGVNMNTLEGGLFLSIDRNTKIFCEDCYLYVVLIVDDPRDTPLYYSVKWEVDRGIVHLKESEIFDGTVYPDNHGQHFIVDLREEEYDSDVYLGFQKKDCFNDTLTVDVALTSFDDGEWDTCKSTTLEGTGLREWGIHRMDDCHRVGGVYYIRVWDATQVANSCSFTIVYRLTRSPVSNIYKDKFTSYTSKKDKVGIAYYRIAIPAEEFVDITSVTITMKDIFYTSTGSFWYGFDVFYGPQKSTVHVNNPKDPSTYVYTQNVNYRNTISFTVTEDQEGWCTDCTYAFSVRTVTETTWVITAELGYTPFMLIPNQPRQGTLKAYTGEIESYIYLHLSSPATVEIACKKLNDKDPNVILYVAATPHASAANHGWKDTTAADGRAEIELAPGHPDYCVDCYYYIGVFFMDEAQESSNVQLELSFNCPGDVCKHCNPGFDPASDCTTCLPGYYGSQCTKCPNCNHGKCQDGKEGSGKCVCDEGWGPSETCNQCLEGFWGIECSKCPNCNGHGKCNDGLHGDGVCKCDKNFDERIDCEDCKPGFFGETCDGVCPATETGICSNNGVCNDKMEGNGRCTCKKGFVGLKCDTEFAKDKCNPHCVVNQGACDEEQGICICFDGYSGKDCNKQAVNIWVTISIALMSIIIVIVIIIAVKMMHCSGSPRRGKKSQKDANAALLSGSV